MNNKSFSNVPPPLARRTLDFGETIFSQISALAIKHGAVNLGQGFPDFDPPEFVLQAAHDAIARGSQQYARGAGLPALVEVLARQLEGTFGRSLDPLAEITITVGATEALFAVAQAVLDPGDEVILFEPFYDSYPADVTLSGGVPRFVPLRPEPGGRWGFDADELRRTFSPRTKAIFVNTPHNPTGKVFERSELELIAELCQEFDCLAICDEVYEQIIFDGQRHLRMASLPGMWERTITIGSAGKTFSVTGWKVGWVVASAALSEGVRRIHQWIPFAVSTPLQAAVAQALEQAEERDYYGWLRQMYQRKRDKLLSVLATTPLRLYEPGGTYFILADISGASASGDVEFCRFMIEEIGVAVIPPSAFYSEEHKHLARDHARFCFCKEDSTLDEAARRLTRLQQAERPCPELQKKG